MGDHDGHRDRIRKRFMEYGLDTMLDHEALELLLYYTSARGDVNPVAHRLLKEFKTLSGVFDAPYEDLLKIKGVGEKTAVLIKLLPELSRRYMIDRSGFEDILDTTSKAGDFIKSYFFGRQEESVYMLCLDGKYQVTAVKKLSDGDVSSAGVPLRKMVEYALTYKAAGVILAHNHPSGIALPSQEDMETTRRARIALANVDVTLHDHIIVGNDDFVSLADNGFFRDEPD